MAEAVCFAYAILTLYASSSSGSKSLGRPAEGGSQGRRGATDAYCRPSLHRSQATASTSRTISVSATVSSAQWRAMSAADDATQAVAVILQRRSPGVRHAVFTLRLWPPHQPDQAGARGRGSGTRRAFRCKLEPEHLEAAPLDARGSQERSQGRLRAAGLGSSLGGVVAAVRAMASPWIHTARCRS
jgi:hypothetical protein